jgi:hypothetical protein
MGLLEGFGESLILQERNDEKELVGNHCVLCIYGWL